MKKVLSSILLVVYSIIAITVTVLLLSYNDYNCSEIGGYTVYIVNDDSLEPEYKQGTILLIKGTSDKNVQIGDSMFLYKVINSQEYELVTKTLVEKAQQGNHITYLVENSENYASDYFIGKTSDTVVIEGWGYVLSLLESKWGYLFCVVIVSLLLFLQEVFELIMEIRYGRETRRKEAAEANDKIASGTTKKASNKTKTTTGTAKKASNVAKATNGTTKKAGNIAKSASDTAKKVSNTTKTAVGAVAKTANIDSQNNNEANVEE